MCKCSEREDSKSLSRRLPFGMPFSALPDETVDDRFASDEVCERIKQLFHPSEQKAFQIDMRRCEGCVKRERLKIENRSFPCDHLSEYISCGVVGG